MVTQANAGQSEPSQGQTVTHWVIPGHGPVHASLLTLADSQAPANAESARTRAPVAIQRMASRVDDMLESLHAVQALGATSRRVKHCEGSWLLARASDTLKA
jgi:hypothetical protein